MNSFDSRLRTVTFAIFFPTLVTWCYFVAMAKQPPAIQQGAYAVGKVIQFSLPLVWVLSCQAGVMVMPKFSWRGVGLGTLLGVFVAVAIGLLYVGWLKDAEIFANASEAIRAKVVGLGVNTPAEYLVLGLFYSVGHSWLEEYYWRWFVFGLLRRPAARPAIGFRAPVSEDELKKPRATMPLLPAVVISSLGFMAHHVLVLGTLFGWENPLTYVLSAGVAVGGMAWAWLYDRSGTLYGAWISHVLIDAALFAVGYCVVSNSLN